ncbi:MAG: tyrosine-type recombinase/integrase [Dehalococcoidia bacterium]|nr:tyrosine-type recombinase/integrase [Dehalococcoidia bacterium]
MPRRKGWLLMDSTLPFPQLRAAFASYNRTTNKSPRTVSWYDQRLELFERHIGSGATLADVTVERARDFIAALQARDRRYENNPHVRAKEGPLSSSYVQGFVRALRAFSSWLYEDGYTATNRLKPVRPPKVQQKVKAVLDDAEIGRLLGQFDRQHPYGMRNYCIMLTLLDTGLRASELCGLVVDDAHLEQGFLKVLGKGDKERLVPIGVACADALTRWRDRTRPLFDTSDEPYLFLSSTGAALTVNGLDQLVRRAGARAGIPRVHPHLLRHTFATNYLVKEVGDPLRLQQVLGHTSLEMVRRYVSAASVQQSLVDRRASPMDLIIRPSGGRRSDGSPRRGPPRQSRPKAQRT